MTFEALRLLAAGYQPAKLLHAALELGLFDALAGGPATAAELSRILGVDARATAIAANALVALEVLEGEAGGYRNGEAAERFLVSTSGEYRGEILRHLGRGWADWGALEGTWRTGRSPAAARPEALPEGPAALRHFILGMENLTRELAPHLADLLPLADCRRVLDLGGGPGNYALALARRWPELTAVHFDLPRVSAVARAFVAGQPGSDRLEFRVGDFRTDPLGEGYGAVWVSQVIHMLGEDGVRALLGRARDVLLPGGLLAIHDHFLDPGGTSPRSSALFGVHMLAVTEGGRSYGFLEVEGWLQEAGYVLAGRLDYGGPARVLLARTPRPERCSNSSSAGRRS